MDFSREAQAARIANIRNAEESVKKCVFRHRIYDYLPGQVIYALTEYPHPGKIMPTEYDEERIRSLAQAGASLIQIHEDWNDSQRLMGADKYSTYDPEGMRAFIDLCHRYNIKIIPYVSSGFLDMRDPDMKPEYNTTGKVLTELWYRNSLNSLSNAGWRQYILTNVRRVLDSFDFDGIYNDAGYDGGEPSKVGYDPDFEDALVLLYQMVKSRGGIVKLHICGNEQPITHDKVYDYLWIGEGCSDFAQWKQSLNYPRYVVPCPDPRLEDGRFDEDAVYAFCLPMMQFPLLQDGRPSFGLCYSVPGIEYNTTDFWYINGQEMLRKTKNDPRFAQGIPPRYDRPDSEAAWRKYLKLYQPMVTEGSVGYIGITESPLIAGNLPEETLVSLFVNEKQYLVVSNLGAAPVSVRLAQPWTDREDGTIKQELRLQPRRMALLERSL